MLLFSLRIIIVLILAFHFTSFHCMVRYITLLAKTVDNFYNNEEPSNVIAFPVAATA